MPRLHRVHWPRLPIENEVTSSSPSRSTSFSSQAFDLTAFPVAPRARGTMVLLSATSKVSVPSTSETGHPPVAAFVPPPTMYRPLRFPDT